MPETKVSTFKFSFQPIELVCNCYQWGRVPGSSPRASFGRKPNLSEEPPVWFQYCHSDLDDNDADNDDDDDDGDDDDNDLLGADNLDREGKDHHEDPLAPDASHQPASQSSW